MYGTRRTHDMSKSRRPAGALAIAPEASAAPAAESAPAAAVRTVPVTVTRDGAQEVILTGEFTGWARDRVRMAHAAGGAWRAQLELPPGEYQYRLIVDGEWRDDAAAPKRVPNPFGSENCVLIVR